MKNSDNHATQADFNPPPLSILQRLDRLDRRVAFVEEKHKHCVKVKVEGEEDECCKWLLYSSDSALQQALQKGTVMERLANLETRLLQLSLDMEMGNMTSVTSTSSTAPHLKLNGMITTPVRPHRKWLNFFQLGCSSSS